VLGRSCAKMRRWSGVVFWLATGFLLLGAGFAFLA
jgi:hypothetical protein